MSEPRTFVVPELFVVPDPCNNEATMIRRYSGDKKSIEARTADNGKTWSVKFFDTGRLTQYSGGTLAEVDALAAKHGLKLDR
jgi:hypothetical protein